jgi:hypothetical protein
LAAKSTSGKNDVFGDWTDEQARRRTMDHRSDSMEPAMKLYNESGEMINLYDGTAKAPVEFPFSAG